MLIEFKDTSFIKGRIKYYQEQLQVIRDAYEHGEKVSDRSQFLARIDYLLLDITEDSLDLALAFDSTVIQTAREKIRNWKETLDAVRYTVKIFMDNFTKDLF